MSPILGIDFGQVRIGLAVSDELHLLAHPLQTIASNRDSLKKISEIIREKKIGKVIVGIPRQMSGQIGKAANQALEFAAKLRASLPCEVHTWDERLTTVAANRALRDAGKKMYNARKYVDQVAAQMILQGYLDRQREVVSAHEGSG